MGVHRCIRRILLSNTLKIKRLEHWSYRQERNFTDRERMSTEVYSGVQEPALDAFTLTEKNSL
jgi:SRSO17 transposase